MKRILLTIIVCLCALCIHGASSNSINLYYAQEEDIVYVIINDGSGSSTVNPVDPNLARAELVQNTLVVQEKYEGDVELTVRSENEVVFSGLFDRTIHITLSDSTWYTLVLHKSDTLISGQFRYPFLQTNPISRAKKLMQQGQLLIRKDNNIYTITGNKLR